jgi:hypothetical protein
VRIAKAEVHRRWSEVLSRRPSRRAIPILALLAATSALVAVSASMSPALANASPPSWSAPDPIEIAGALDSVSCPSTSFCMAVDTSGYAFTYNGSAWSAPVNIFSDELFSVSCPSASFCVAVGHGKALTYNGTSWSAPVTIDTSGGEGDFESVSCLSSSFCAAVGRFYGASGNSYGDTATYNGTSWSAVHISGTVNLYSVSCSSTSFCAAVGDTENYAGNAYTYNGKSWSAPANIMNNGPLQYLDSVSCPSTSFCMAVDSSGTASTYNGSSWSAPVKTGDGYTYLYSVSCVSASFCIAVGETYPEPYPSYQAVALTYDGSSWSAPVDIESRETYMAVSCATPSFCMVVANANAIAYGNGSGYAPPPPPPPPAPCAAGVCAVVPIFGPQSGGTPITVTGGPFVSGNANAYMVCFKRVGSYGGVCTGATVVNGTTLHATTPPRPVSESPGPYLISTETITAGSGNLDIQITPSNVTFDFDATYQAPGDASLAGAGTYISLTTAHFPGEQGYASLQDSNPNAAPAGLHASIDWGDGTGTALATLAPVSTPGTAGTTSGTQTLSTLPLTPTTLLPNGSLFSVDAPAHNFANVAPGENEYDTWVTVTDSAGSFATMLTPVVITMPLPPHTQPVPHGPTVTLGGAAKTLDIGHTLYACGVAIAAGGGPEDPFADGACLLSTAFSLDIETVTGDDPPDARVTEIPSVHHVHVRATCPRSRGARSRQCRRIASGTHSYLSASEVTAAIALAQAESVDRFDTAVRRGNSSAAVLQRAVIYAYAGALLPAVQRQNAAAAFADRALAAAHLVAPVTSHQLLGDYRHLSRRLPPGLRAFQARQHIPSLTKMLRPSLQKLEGGSQAQLLAPTLPLAGFEQTADEMTLGGVLQILSALRHQHAITTGAAASKLAGDIVSLGAPPSPALMQQFDHDLQQVQPAYRPLVTGAVTALQDADTHATPHLSPG